MWVITLLTGDLSPVHCQVGRLPPLCKAYYQTHKHSVSDYVLVVHSCLVIYTHTLHITCIFLLMGQVTVWETLCAIWAICQSSGTTRQSRFLLSPNSQGIRVRGKTWTVWGSPRTGLSNTAINESREWCNGHKQPNMVKCFSPFCPVHHLAHWFISFFRVGAAFGSLSTCFTFNSRRSRMTWRRKLHYFLFYKHRQKLGG